MPTSFTKTLYKTIDGVVFETFKAAETHEFMLEACKKALTPLGSYPKAIEDNKGWIQHSRENYEKAHKAIVKLSIPYFKSWKELSKMAKEEPLKIYPLGVAGRIISECAPQPLNQA